MSTYRMDDGTVVNTENAVQSWEGRREWDGHNQQDIHAAKHGWETLHKSRKGRYWIERGSAWQGDNGDARWIDKREAAAWLILNEDELPKDLAALESEVSE